MLEDRINKLRSWINEMDIPEKNNKDNDFKQLVELKKKEWKR